jgi:hypothetical protein
MLKDFFTAEDGTIIPVGTSGFVITEEYHKCFKTGCKVEEAQLKTGKRLMALLGRLGVIATQLLRLRVKAEKTLINPPR